MQVIRSEFLNIKKDKSFRQCSQRDCIGMPEDQEEERAVRKENRYDGGERV